MTGNYSSQSKILSSRYRKDKNKLERLIAEANSMHDSKDGYECKLCDWKGSYKSTFINHLSDIHRIRMSEYKMGLYEPNREDFPEATIPDIYKCKLCDWKSQSHSGFRNHLRRSHGLRISRYRMLYKE